MPFGGVAIVADGLVLSILNDADVKILVFPALSVTVTEPVTGLPSLESKSGLAGDIVSRPERLSADVKGTFTLLLFQPNAFAGGIADPNARVGAVLSMLIPVLETGALTLPALSVQVPGPAVWAAPSALSVTGKVQESIVDRASVPVKVTVTSVLFQTLSFASGNWAAETVGAVLSMLIPVLETGA